MKKILFLVIFSCQFSFAYFAVEENYYKEAQVLSSLDIDMSFFQDSRYLKMKKNMKQDKTKPFLRMLDNGSEFVPVLKDMLKEADIPEAFLYLAMAESEFSTRAYSKAKASGLWQFMTPTAKKFGLEIDEYIDERRDPIKSTKAAIEYLQFLHDRFGKWYLAAMAYNCGEGRLSRAINLAGSDDIKILLDEDKKYIPRETRNYIRKIVMMAHLSESTNFIVGNDADYFLNRGSSLSSFKKIDLGSGVSLQDVASAIEIPLEQLLGYNHHLNYPFTPPNKKSYHVYIPYDKQALFAKNYDPSAKSSKFKVHIVKSGDSLYRLGKKYNVSHQGLRDFNQLGSSNILKIGQKLIIPIIEKEANYHTVKNGDTLISISSRYKTSVESLMQANNLEDATIYIGGKLEIPANF